MSPSLTLRSRDVSLLADKLILQNNLNVSELHNLAIEEVYATNSSFKHNILNESVKGMRNKNREMKAKLRYFVNRLKKLKNLSTREKYENKIESFDTRLGVIKEKLEKLKKKLSSDKLKESLNLFEMNLGDDVVDVEKKNLINKIKNVKEDLDIEQKNNINLRAKILEKESEIKNLQEELKKAKMEDQRQVTDEDLILKNKELIEKVAELQKKKADVEVQIGDIRKRYKFSYKKMNEMKQEMEDIKNNMNTLEMTVENQRKQLKEKDEEIEKIQKEKGKDPEQVKSSEDYQKDLAMGNKENERLNSLLEEERWKVENLQQTIKDLQDKLKLAKQNENQTKIKLNLTSQMLRQQEQGSQVLDPNVQNPQEFRLQGKQNILSFRHLERGTFQNNLAKTKTESELDQTMELKDPQNMSLLNTSDNVSKKNGVDQEQTPKNIMVSPMEVLESQDKNISGNSTTTYNINNITLTTINVVSNPSNPQNEYPSGEQKKQSNDLSSMENENKFSKSSNFMEKLSNSFDLKSNDDVDSGKSQPLDLPEFKSEIILEKRDKKSDYNKLFIDSNMEDSEEDSSIASLIQKTSPRNSGADHKKIIEKYQKQIKTSPRSDDLRMKKDLNPVPKNHEGNTGNMIQKNPKRSVTSMIDEERRESNGKNLTKSLFALKTMSNENNSINEKSSLKNDVLSENAGSLVDKEMDSFEDMFGEKKEIGSGVFSKRENTVFEEDVLLEDMMKDDDVKVGETTSAYSQRIISKNQQKKKDDNVKNEGKKVQEEKKSNLLEAPKKKNVFNTSFQNESFAFASNQKEQSLLMVPGQILNNDQSFAAGDRIFNTNQSFAGNMGAFDTAKSFGTNGLSEITKVMDNIKIDSERMEQLELNEKHPGKETPTKKQINLMIVPEEGMIEEEFNFDLPKKEEQNSPNQFDSTNSLNLFGDQIFKDKKIDQPTGMLDLMKDFNTDNFDQQMYNKVFGNQKPKEVRVEESCSPSIMSPNESDDEMFLEVKFIQTKSKDD